MGRSIYTIEDIDSELDFAPNAFVALDYSGAPTVSQLEQEITADLHTNQFQEIGCHICGNVDMFTRELNNKGRRYRCGYCLYNSESEFETVKSQKDITLSSFGLDYVCDICGEVMDSYNRGTIIKHIQKHEDANKSFASETTDSKIRQWLKVLRDTDPDWEEIDWEKPSDKPDPDWGIEWEAERRIVKGMRKCDICSMPARPDEDLCSNCWTEYLSATYANNNWKEHQHQEAIAILNWMCKPADKPKEPMACPRCNSDELEHSYDDLPDDETIITSSGTITANTNKNEIRRHYSCGSCSAVWVESWIYDSLLIVKRGTKS